MGFVVVGVRCVSDEVGEHVGRVLWVGVGVFVNEKRGDDGGLCFVFVVFFFFFQAEDGIRDLVRSRGLGGVYKRQ